jgi:signal transduction histidine kinase
VTLRTDEARLQQVLINLLINATKFTTEGSITLTLEKESETIALFTVTDTGCGILREKQDQIFNRFEKLNEGAQGTGLGLSICQLIIEQIGGRIWIDPDYTEGARFRFTHPVRPAKEKEAER